MALNIGKEIAALKRMTVPELRRRYAETFGESTRSRHKEFLIRRIAWRLQANEEGGLSERSRARARELAAGSDTRLTAPRKMAPAAAGTARVARIEISQDARLPMPGAVLTRRYKGETIEVRVLPGGFEYEGEVYSSLSAVAKKVTGTHWNGYHFFKVGRKGDANGRKDKPLLELLGLAFLSLRLGARRGGVRVLGAPVPVPRECLVALDQLYVRYSPPLRGVILRQRALPGGRGGAPPRWATDPWTCGSSTTSPIAIM